MEFNPRIRNLFIDEIYLLLLYFFFSCFEKHDLKYKQTVITVTHGHSKSFALKTHEYAEIHRWQDQVRERMQKRLEEYQKERDDDEVH
jgi:hypothetical protein